MSIDPEKLLDLAKRRHGPAGVTLSWPMVINIVDELRRLQRECDELAAHVDALHGAILGPQVASYTDAESAEEARRIAMSGPTGSLARRDNEQFRQGFWWGFERARCNPEAMNIRAEFEEVQRLRRQSEEAPCSSTSSSASPSVSC